MMLLKCCSCFFSTGVCWFSRLVMHVTIGFLEATIFLHIKCVARTCNIPLHANQSNKIR